MSSKITDTAEYGNKVEMLITSPKNCGDISSEEIKELDADLFIYEYGSEKTGEKITLYWAIDKSDDTIALARFTYFGSVTSIAANDMAALLCRSKTVDKAAEISYKGLEYFLRDNPSTPALPEEENYAITLVLDAIKEASQTYLDEAKDPNDIRVSNDSPMKISAIKETIKLHDIQDIETLTHYTKAGLYDKASVKPSPLFEERSQYLVDILKATRDEIDAEKESKLAPLDMPFMEMNMEQRVVAINKVIDDSIRQYLVMDGGDMEILDVKDNGDDIDIYFRWLGACAGCGTASMGTQFAIETALKEKLYDKIRVVPI
ncbi:MAG: iron-sulfur cluster assembly scaffold protein NifU [Sulfurovum sp.]|nr:iron-sulfur cluster assembly scaffold protein NifU [Sulfurovum sp.]